MAVSLKVPGIYSTKKVVAPIGLDLENAAVPVFIGYTEKDDSNGEMVLVYNLESFEETFGGPDRRLSVSVASDSDYTVTTLNPNAYALRHLMYYGMQLYFENGGGPCYIMSAGAYPPISDVQFNGDDFTNSQGTAPINRLEKLSGPNVIIAADLPKLGNPGKSVVSQALLAHCAKTQSRFAILDPELLETGDNDTLNDIVTAFESNVGMENLQYGAAYYPWVQTDIPLSIATSDAEIVLKYPDTSVETLADALANSGGPTDEEAAAIRSKIAEKEFGSINMVLPPSFAVAAVYTKTDSSRGAWKAPANESLTSVVQGAISLTEAERGNLNVPQSGKAINTLKPINGRGMVIWGARTLAGNSNEWRYVPVRRLFIAVEQTVKAYVQGKVFETNDAAVWQALKNGVNGYLNSLWRRGAFAGNTPEESYFVQVGLGETMTNEDILNGRMIVNIGLAVARPAEFIEVTVIERIQST